MLEVLMNPFFRRDPVVLLGVEETRFGGDLSSSVLMGHTTTPMGPVAWLVCNKTITRFSVPFSRPLVDWSLATTREWYELSFVFICELGGLIHKRGLDCKRPCHERFHRPLASDTTTKGHHECVYFSSLHLLVNRDLKLP